ncbi:ABC transporter permease [Paenibacillus humicola]|uniref:ABC transporter permease n=1 Tax=Paenibacillus humicola TaxID=3110540 RepID=UPI00237B957D|nr:ABC transporter permease [Paenibacillus humicola]
MKTTDGQAVISRKTSAAPASFRTWIAVRQMSFYPWLAGILILLLWQLKLFHRLLKLELYQLPIPSDIWGAFRDQYDLLLNYMGYTGVEIFGGFLVGSLLGFVIAIPASLYPNGGRGGIAMIAMLNAVPIVALAPVMNNWFGDGVASRIGVVSVLTMATMCVNAFKGMTSIDPAYFELMQSYAASKWKVFFKIRLPHGLPNVFAALKINMTTSIIGAIVGEFFYASRGLGYLLSDQIKLANMPLSWACISLAAILGIILYFVVQSTERFFIP